MQSQIRRRVRQWHGWPSAQWEGGFTFEEWLRGISSSECGGGRLCGGEDGFDSFEGEFPSVESIARGKAVCSFHVRADEGGLMSFVVVVMFRNFEIFRSLHNFEIGMTWRRQIPIAAGIPLRIFHLV
jgi:hypothetical protein